MPATPAPINSASEPTHQATQAMGNELFDMVAGGKVRIRIDKRYALADVAEAHRDLEARRLLGSAVLLP